MTSTAPRRPLDTMKGGVAWVQPPLANDSVEITIPRTAFNHPKVSGATIPADLLRKDFTVEVDAETHRILTISYTPSRNLTTDGLEDDVSKKNDESSISEVVWQSQLFAAVELELSWYILSKNALVVEVKKEVENRWEELLCVPIPSTGDDHYLSIEELNDAAALLFPPLPPATASALEEGSASEESGEALATPDTSLPPSIQEAQKRELLRYATEEEACRKKLAELKDRLAESGSDATNNGDDEETTVKKVAQLHKSINLTERLLSIVCETRALRRRPTTVASILEYQKLEVLKGRVNIGEDNMEEIEEYANPEEEAMSGNDIFLFAIAILRSQTNPAEAVRLLRVAATKKANANAAITLLAVYREAPTSFVRAVTALLKIALDDSNGIDRRANHYIGNLFNDATRFFPRNWAMAVYFYQRAATAGSAASMRCLWELLHNGECANHAPPNAQEPESQPLVFPSPLRAEFFLEASVDRGNVAAFVVFAKNLAMGSEDVEPDVERALQFIETARAAEPLMSRSVEFRSTDAFVQSKLAEKRTTNQNTTADAADDEIEDLPLPRSNEAASHSPAHPVPSSIAASNVDRLNPTNTKPTAADRLARYCEEFGGVNVDDAQPNRPPASNGIMASMKGGSRSLPGTSKTPVGEGEKSKQFWERSAKVGIVFGAMYFFAFPIRAMILPGFYGALQAVMEMLGLGKTLM